MVVAHVDLRLEAGELLGLIGPNGAGKSTLLKAIAQLLPHRGQVYLAGRSARRISVRERARRMAYLSQDNQVQWPILVRELVGLGRHPHRTGWGEASGEHDGGGASAADIAAIDAAMRAADIWELRERRADQLSGGERARARLARVLAVGAPLILADEPVAALDPRHQLEVMHLLRSHCGGGGAVIVVLHDLTLASRFCDRLLLLDEGRLVAAGPVDAVLTAANLRRVYGIAAITARHNGQAYVVPWARVDRQAQGQDGRASAENASER